MELLKRKILLANCLLNEACYFRFKKKTFLQPFSFKHGIFNPLKHTYYSRSVYGNVSTSAGQQEEEMVLWSHERDHRSWELHSFGPDFTASMWIHNTTSCPDVPQEKQKDWCISMSIFSSPRYKWKRTKPRQTYWPKVFLPSKEKKKQQQQKTISFLNREDKDTHVLACTTVASISSETQCSKLPLVQVSPPNNLVSYPFWMCWNSC